MKLGKLKQVELREIWKHEAINFTNWLAIPENLELLSEEIDIEINVIATEHNVGRYNVDIYAEEPNTSKKVIIENQLERTDHDHLGKLITYASGLDAEIIIWIVKEVLEEHQQAINWLNEHTDEHINFFAIKMEVWQIGDSEPAAKFHVISQPNNWTKSVKQSIKKAGFSDTQLLQLKFWDAFKQFASDNNYNIKLRKTYGQHWYDISIGRSDCHMSLTINTQKSECACEIYIPNSKETFSLFLEHKEDIEAQTGKLLWMELPNKKACRVKKVSKGSLKKEDQWQHYFKWMADTAVVMQDTFSKY